MTDISYLKNLSDLDIDQGGQDHVLIEGDNLEVLKALQFTHANSVDMIYIDPPYNTKADVDYRDGWERTDWMEFMRPRLRLAHSLLKNTGVICVSIDDDGGMMPWLMIMLSEIFGESNRLPTQIWQGKSVGKDPKNTHIVQWHEYVLSYAKDIRYFKSSDLMRKTTDKKFPKVDEATGKRYRIVDLRKAGEDSLRSESPSMYYPVIDPDGNEHFPVRNDGQDGRWHWGKDRMAKEVESGENIVWTKTKVGAWRLNYKRWQDEEEVAGHRSVIVEAEEDENGRRSKIIGPSGEGAKRLAAQLGTTKDGEKMFGFPKPISLMQYLIDWGTAGKKDAVVLDYFVGSGSTADALIDMNAKDGGNRKGIFVTNNESNIFYDATYPRIKAAITGEWANGKGSPVEASLRVFTTGTVSNEKDGSLLADYSLINLLSNKFSGIVSLKENVFNFTTEPDYTLIESDKKTVLVWTNPYDDEELEHLLLTVEPDATYIACESTSIYGVVFDGGPSHEYPLKFVKTQVSADKFAHTLDKRSIV